MSRGDLQVKFRLPADLKDRLEAAAKANKRSMTAELIALLESALPGRDSTVRDMFIAAAFSGLVSKKGDLQFIENIAKKALEYADVMLAAREAKP